jgi:hypothetical protein
LSGPVRRNPQSSETRLIVLDKAENDKDDNAENCKDDNDDSDINAAADDDVHDFLGASLVVKVLCLADLTDNNTTALAPDHLVDTVSTESS